VDYRSLETRPARNETRRQAASAVPAAEAADPLGRLLTRAAAGSDGPEATWLVALAGSEERASAGGAKNEGGPAI
jgi:hypothetical protein